MWRWRFSKRTKRLTFLAVGKLFFFFFAGVITRCSRQDVSFLFFSLSTHSLDVGESVAFWEVVRVPFPEHVTHAAAGENLQASSAHPHPEGELCGRTGRHRGGGGHVEFASVSVYEWFGLISIISIRVLPVHLLHLSCSRWPQAVNQQYEAVVADNLMLCCLADSKDTFGTTDGRASAASRSICRYPVPGRPQQDWIHEIQPSECPVV